MKHFIRRRGETATVIPAKLIRIRNVANINYPGRSISDCKMNIMEQLSAVGRWNIFLYAPLERVNVCPAHICCAGIYIYIRVYIQVFFVPHQRKSSPLCTLATFLPFGPDSASLPACCLPVSRAVCASAVQSHFGQQLNPTLHTVCLGGDPGAISHFNDSTEPRSRSEKCLSQEPDKGENYERDVIS